MGAITGTLIGLSLVLAGLMFAIPSVMRASSNTESSNLTEQLVDPKGPEVQFVLFTRNTSAFKLQHDNLDLNLSNFNNGHPTKIIIHGFMSSIKNNVFQLMKNAYLDTGNYNVIGMDWSFLCQIEYTSAMRGVKIAGQHLTDFINWLTLNGVKTEDVHIIGHSLGAHVAGVGADGIEGGRRIGRITGLDPAGPGYGDVSEEMRLDSQDAKLVDVIHTFMRFIGTTKPLGHVDFYPNGGQYQPGCPNVSSLKVADSIFCNHGRSYELFAESIRNPNSFKSQRCGSLEEALSARCLEESDVYMGQMDTYKNGLYYFKTRSEPPYSMENLTAT
ncbi:hypothetical protein ABEB36_001566 [Hypothenemus hampei]|uniref:Lipase domain-containing protein n=1 Tax=Hypothenemus hampei TaxID=57062 RepID=A0ABD1FF01_HYPHA